MGFVGTVLGVPPSKMRPGSGLEFSPVLNRTFTPRSFLAAGCRFNPSRGMGLKLVRIRNFTFLAFTDRRNCWQPGG